MITIVYYEHDSGDLSYESFDTTAEAQAWMNTHDYKAILIETVGGRHYVSDHT